MSGIGGAVPDIAMWADFFVDPSPFRHLRPGIVKAEEPLGVKAVVPELTVDGPDESTVRRLARLAEPVGSAKRIQARSTSVRPICRGAGDEPGARVDPDQLGIANLAANPFQKPRPRPRRGSLRVYQPPASSARRYPRSSGFAACDLSPAGCARSPWPRTDWSWL
jgi:hypothetical protein